MNFCIHVVLIFALLPYFLCRQSLAYFSAPAGGNFGVRDSKSASFLNKKTRYFEDLSRYVEKLLGY